VSVAFDAIAESAQWTTGNGSHTHTPVATPRGIIVLIMQGGGTGANGGTDDIASVTYGGVAMTRLQAVNKAAAESLSNYLYFLGAAIPAGPQTVLCTTIVGTNAIKKAWSISVTAATTETAAEGSGALSSDALANPSITVVTGAGVETYAVGSLTSGQNTIGTVTAGAGYTLLDQHDINSQTGHVEDIDANDAGGNVVVNFTVASDDVGMTAIAVKEAGSPLFVPRTTVVYS